jgi:hypothetical protein
LCSSVSLACNPAPAAFPKARPLSNASPPTSW